MNKITFPRHTYDGNDISQKDLEDWFCTTFESNIKERLQDTINTKKLSRIQVITCRLILVHLHDILIASPHRLEYFTDFCDRYGKSLFYTIKRGKVVSTSFGNEIIEIFNYNNYRESKLIGLARQLNIKSCPYCNMQFTLFAEDKSKKLLKFQFDHFYDKAKYPFLSMSLYNLIPSCSVCNHSKSNDKLPLKFHPYASNIHEQFHFEVDNPVDLYIGGKIDKININLIPDIATTTEINQYDDVFHIKALYSRHRDVAQEVFDKVYQESYYLDETTYWYMNAEEKEHTLRLLMGTYPYKKDIEKRPMTKFIQDLWRQAKGWESWLEK